MMHRLVDSSLKFRRLIVAAAAGLLIVGIVQVGNTKVDVLPEFNPPMVEVQTEALGLSAEEVEQLITVPLEQDLLVGVPFLEEIESVSLPGLSSVVMTFEPGTDLLDARQVVQERLTQAVGIAGLPQVAKLPQMIQPLSSSSRVAMVKLSSEQLTPIEVSVLARWVIGPRLMSIPGVANVVGWGNRERQLQVLVDPQRLSENNTTLSEVISTAGNALEVSPLSFLQASSPGTGGFIDTPNQRLNIFHEQAIRTPEQLAQVPLEGSGGGAVSNGPSPLALGDVTDVVENHQPLIGDAICAGGEDCMLLVVEKFPGANTVDVTRGVERALQALRPGLADVQMDSSVYRPASFIQSSFTNVGWALLAGGLLLLLLIGAVFWDWRRSLVGVAAIGVSAATALLVLQVRDTTVNLMVAAGLLVGLTAVIHDALGDVDNLARRLAERDPKRPRVSIWKTIVDVSAEMRSSVLYAALIVAAAMLPVFFMPAEGGAFLPPIALAYLLAVASSMLVAILVTPALALMLLSKHSRHESPVVSRTQRAYDRRAPGAFARAGVALAICAGFAVVGLAAAPFLDTDLRPELKERDVLVHVDAAPGTSLPRMTTITRELVDDLESVDGVANVGSHVGRAVMADEIVDVNSGEIWVRLDSDADYDTTVAAIESAVGNRSEITTDVLTYSDERVTDVLGRSGHDLVLRVYGENADVLDSKATELRGLVAGVEGVTSANVDRAPEEPTLEVEVDLQRAQSFGIKPGDVRRAASMLLGGITVGNLFDEQKVFDVVVWGTPGIRDSATDIEQLLIDTPDGGHVQLGQVADVRVVPSPTVIRHESVASYLDVTAQVSGRDVGDVAAEVDELIDGVTFPLDHHAELLGVYAEQQADQWRTMAAAFAGAIAIFLLLQAAFGSWRVAALAFVLLPLALVGGVAAVLLSGGTVTLGSIAGFIAVLGIAARGVVVLIRRFQQLQRTKASDAADAVLQGTRESLAPSLMSMLAIVALLVPIAVAPGATGFDVLHPMVIVVMGGLVTTAVVILFVVPALYLRFGFVSGRDLWDDDEDLAVPVPQQRQAPPEKAGVLQRIRATTSVLPVIGSGLLLTSCGGSVAADAYTIEHEPAHTEHVEGSDHVQVVLEPSATERLAIQTTPVKGTADGLTVPTTALFVDVEGTWWVYTNPEPHVFVRHQVDLEREHDGTGFLASGPRPGTEVVTVGVAELAGIEDEVGH